MRPTLSIKFGQSHTRYAVPSSLTGQRCRQRLSTPLFSLGLHKNSQRHFSDVGSNLGPKQPKHQVKR
jgi:hypothetical protein